MRTSVHWTEQKTALCYVSLSLRHLTLPLGAKQYSWSHITLTGPTPQPVPSQPKEEGATPQPVPSRLKEKDTSHWTSMPELDSDEGKSMHFRQSACVHTL